MNRLLLCFTLIAGLVIPVANASASDEVLIRTAAEREGGYNRSFFKHWIDADRNGCDTRKEVLIEEAVVKPKKGPKCTLTGGKWVSSYDGKTYTKDSALDIDHVVPLAEAWRSGAWAWTPAQRQEFANDIRDSRVLIAVTASANRSKGDRDVKSWLPAKDKCSYIEAWVAVKVRYTLTFDPGELSVIQNYFTSCNITNVSAEVLVGYETEANRVTSAPSPTPVATPSASPSPTPSPSPVATASTSPTPSPTPTPVATVSASPTPSPIPITTVSASPTPAPVAPTKSPAVKYKNCAEAKAAGVAPLRKATNPELYEINSGLDRDKDGVACES